MRTSIASIDGGLFGPDNADLPREDDSERASHPDLPPKLDTAADFCFFINGSPTPFHAIESVKNILIGNRFEEIREEDPWDGVVKPGGKYFVTRNGSSIVAFCVGKLWLPGNPIAMIGTHSDSHSMRVKPISKIQKDGFLQVGVEVYGGGLMHTWFDRDLSLAGRVIFGTSTETLQTRLVKINEPILRIPSLPPHLDPQRPFAYDAETHLTPITGLVEAELNRSECTETESGSVPKHGVWDFRPLPSMIERHHPCVVRVVAEKLNIAPSEIQDFELIVYDTQKAAIGGVNKEMIFASRLDSLMMSYCSVMGLVRSVSLPEALEEESSVRMSCLFDNEEEGSTTRQGARSNFASSVLRRLSLLSFPDRASSKPDPSAFEQSLAKSFLISADVGHSVHPNYTARFEANHHPEMNKGPVLKINANENYVTNSPGIVLMQEVARRATVPHKSANGVPLQLYVIRNDSRSGGTIGPMLSAALGCRTLDLGCAILSMHSIRETAGRYDLELAISLFTSYFNNFSSLSHVVML